ncbi:MAG: hypothetical protein J4F35_00980 [Candidatus Latescibacteria bacterium]|nr:hypothetical protein [Candidatus Latescibacterota bacterium]
MASTTPLGKSERSAVSAAEGPRPRVTFLALLVGSLFVFCIAAGAPYANMVLRGSYMALDFSNAGAIFLFFFFVLLVPAILKHSRLKFHDHELAVIYIMALVGSSIATLGLTENFLPIISGGLYYASSENAWTEQIHPYVRRWMLPQDWEAIKYFYEGLPTGYAIPWSAWIKPLLCWIPAILALYFAMICTMVILRRQWIQHERLTFPLIQLPLAMIAEGEQTSRCKPFFKNPIMWTGFAIPFTVGSMRALHNYYNFIPDINLVASFPFFRQTTEVTIALSFPMVGFSYFVNLDIALGIWLFNLIARIEEGCLNILGVSSTETLDFSGPSPLVAHQGMGAMIVLVIFGFWMGRRHLAQVFRKAFLNDESIDDSDEILSYRVAVLGLLVSNLFIGWWLLEAGMAFWVVPIYLFALFLLCIGVSRVVSEGGVASTRTPLIPTAFVTSGLGSSALGPQNLTVLGMTYVWATSLRNLLMASCANGLKLAEEYLPGGKRALFWAILLAIVVSLVSSIWSVLYLSYSYGGINLNGWFFGPSGMPVYPFNFVSRELNSPDGPDIGGWVATAAGGSIMALLMVARQHLTWWPLHPLGFAISTNAMTNYIWFSVFLAWLIKGLVLKYGGPALFQRTRPFFLGLIAGQFSCAGIWLLIDYFTGMTDNNIYWV